MKWKILGTDKINLLVIFCFLLFILNILAWFPGQMSYDSIHQLKEVIAGQYASAHSPVWGGIWKMLSFFFGYSPVPIFIVINLAFLFGDIVFTKILRKQQVFAFFSILILNIILMNQKSTIWKDTIQTSFLYLAILVYYYNLMHPSGHKKSGLFIFVILMFLSSCARINSLPIMVIIIFGYLYQVIFNKLIKAFVMTGVVLAFFIFLQFGLIKIILNVTNTNFSQVLYLSDITSIIVHGDSHASFDERYTKKFPREFEYPTTQKQLNKSYYNFIEASRCDVGQFFNFGVIKTSADEKQIRDLRQTWLRMLRDNFSSYLHGRWFIFKLFLRSPNLKPYYPYQLGVIENDLGIKWEPNVVSSFYKKLLFSIPEVFFKPYLYLISGFLIFFFAALSRNIISKQTKTYLCVINLSSILHFCFLFIIIPACDFRYSFWPVVSVLVSIIILLFELRIRRGSLFAL